MVNFQGHIRGVVFISFTLQWRAKTGVYCSGTFETVRYAFFGCNQEGNTMKTLPKEGGDGEAFPTGRKGGTHDLCG